MRNSNGPAPARSRYLSLYGKLGISPDASPRDIRAAYEVLKSAYCPGGAYLDDAMYKAFSEIRNAAKILCNPRTRRRYDLGYIDEDGRQTGAGRAHAVRLRTAWVTGAAAFAVLAIVVSGVWTVPNEAPGGAQVAGPDTRVNAAAPRVATPPKAMADAAPAPAPPRQARREQNRDSPGQQARARPWVRGGTGRAQLPDPSSTGGSVPAEGSAARGFPPVPRSPRQADAAKQLCSRNQAEKICLPVRAPRARGLRGATGSKLLGRRHLVPAPARLLRLVTGLPFPSVATGALSRMPRGSRRLFRCLPLNGACLPRLEPRLSLWRRLLKSSRILPKSSLLCEAKQ